MLPSDQTGLVIPRASASQVTGAAGLSPGPSLPAAWGLLAFIPWLSTPSCSCFLLLEAGVHDPPTSMFSAILNSWSHLLLISHFPVLEPAFLQYSYVCLKCVCFKCCRLSLHG